MANQLQKELIGIIKTKTELDDYKVILYNHLFTHELNFPVLHIEIEDDSFIVHVVPDDLALKQLWMIDEAFDKFEIIFIKNSADNLIRLKFILDD